MYINNDIDYLKYLREKDIVIFGAGENGKRSFIKLRQRGYKIIAFCDNDEKKQGGVIEGKTVVSFDKLVEMNNSNIMIVICSYYESEIKQQLLNGNIFNYISVSQIDFGGGGEYYDEQYFVWQKKIGRFGGKIKVNLFTPYIKAEMTVVEFGSGGGYLLENIHAKEKIGIEINDKAREAAKEIGVNSVKDIDDIADDYADIIISTSVLEHVENPFETLKRLRRKLKDGGKIVFHIPNESCETEYIRSEINNHLYTWNCLNIGNLFKAAGYFVHSVKNVQTVWPKYYSEIEKEVSPELFEVLCEIGGRAFDKNTILIVAYK